jgi:hypothetical protein
LGVNRAVLVGGSDGKELSRKQGTPQATPPHVTNGDVNFVGIYADPEGTNPHLTILPNTPTKAYLVATVSGDIATNGILNLVFRVAGLPENFGAPTGDWNKRFSAADGWDQIGCCSDEYVFTPLAANSCPKGTKHLIGEATFFYISGENRSGETLVLPWREPENPRFPCATISNEVCAGGAGTVACMTTIDTTPDGLPIAFRGSYSIGSPIDVTLDIKPGSCPNPVNPASRGVLPVALLGSHDFEVSSIDVSSLQLEGVAPLRSSIEDVGTSGIGGDECNCASNEKDGVADLLMKFSTPELVASLSLPGQQQDAILSLNGRMHDGTPFAGRDCVVVVGNSSSPGPDGRSQTEKAAALPTTWSLVKRLYR